MKDPAANQYGEFFPLRSQNWDAVGRLWKDGVEEILLVEAKANRREFNSDCGAKSLDSIKLIYGALAKTKSFLGATGGDWSKGYYQYCNRLATLHFLNQKVGLSARLLFIYFMGDTREHLPVDAGTTDDDASPDKTITESSSFPKTKAEWQRELKPMKEHVGLPREHKLHDRIHELYLHVRGAEPV